MPVLLETNAAEIMRRLSRAPRALRDGVVRGLRGALLGLEGQVTAGAALKWRRGGAGLQGRLTSYARADAALGVDAAIGFRKRQGFPYEMAQEFGATAKAGGAMAIPMSPLARRLSDRGVGPRQSGLILFRPKGKNVLLEYRGTLRGGGYKMQPLHYVLVKRIAPRLNFIKTVTANLGDVSRGIVAGAAGGAKGAA
jgi:hypothetical protein